MSYYGLGGLHIMTTTGRSDGPGIGYREIREQIESWISSGRYPPGAKLPPEVQLAEQFGVSRVTIRRAIELLKRDGVLRGQRGSGTYVTPVSSGSAVRSDFAQYSRQTLDHVDGLVNKVTARRDIPVPEALLSIFPTADNSHVVEIECIRFLNERPFSFVRTHVAGWAAAALDDLRHDLGKARLIDKLFKLHGVSPSRIHQAIGAQPADRHVADYLKVEIGSPLVRVVTNKYDGKGLIYQRAVSLNRADTFEYELDFVGAGYP
ncbi:MAG: GntR family transcriptional regulator [Sphingomonadales bacterium]|nr:GntR family transcriptional regulator [Sphingomonadales bacterium]